MVCFMITNLFVIGRDGRTILASKFGACNSLGNAEMVGGFVNAIYSFGMMLSGHDVSEIKLGSRLFYLSVGKLMFVIATDDADSKKYKYVIKTIERMFMELYGSDPEPLANADPARFEEFPEILISRGIVARNCGKFADCHECENNPKSLPLGEFERELQHITSSRKG